MNRSATQDANRRDKRARDRQLPAPERQLGARTGRLRSINVSSLIGAAKRLCGVLLLAAAIHPQVASAQSNPGFYYRFVPTAAQWNSYFAAKQDVLGYTPINKAGDVFLGRVIMWPSSATGAGVNLGVGSQPTALTAGDLWATTGGFYGYVNGQIIGPFGTSPTGLAGVGGNVQVTAGTDSTSPTSGAFTVVGGAGIAKNLNVGGNTSITGNLTVLNDISWWSQAGLPTTTQIAASTWGVWKDTTGGGVYVAANDGGTIKTVALGAAQRTILTSGVTYFVNPAGNDNCNGTSASLGTSGNCAWATVQKSYNIIASTLDLAGNSVTVQMADGTYTGGLNLNQGWTGGGAVVYQGNASTISTAIISVSAGNCIQITAALPGVVTFQNMRLVNTGGGAGINVVAPSLVSYGNIDFGPMTGGYHILASGSGVNVSGFANTLLSGGAVAHWAATSAAVINDAGHTLTLTGTPVFSNGFAYASRTGVVAVNGNTFSGSAGTGNRYLIDTNGVVYTGTSGTTTYLPGTTITTPTTGGQYF